MKAVVDEYELVYCSVVVEIVAVVVVVVVVVHYVERRGREGKEDRSKGKKIVKRKKYMKEQLYEVIKTDEGSEKSQT